MPFIRAGRFNGCTAARSYHQTGTKAILRFVSQKILDLSKEQKGLLRNLPPYDSRTHDYSGIGEVKAIQLKCVGELSKRLATYKARNVSHFSDPCSIAEYYMEQLRHDERRVSSWMMCWIRKTT